MPPAIDHTGRRYGRLVVERRGIDRQPGRPYWICKCDCGNVAEVSASNLRSGITGSCGCRLLDGSIRRTHGDKASPVYAVWKAIKQRCENPNNKSFSRYGGRGIRLCDRWRDYAKFKEDMGPRPSPMHSVDRIDNNGHYEPENCRWVLPRQQARNKSSNTVAFHNGEWKSWSEWAESAAVSPQLLRSRVVVWGWPFHEALTTPPGKRKSPQPGSPATGLSINQEHAELPVLDQ